MASAEKKTVKYEKLVLGTSRDLRIVRGGGADKLWWVARRRTIGDAESSRELQR